jgi:hypothetical protein
MSDSSRPEAALRCLWCGQPLGEGSPRRRYCSRPRLCRDKAYRNRRRARGLARERGVLASAGYELDQQLQALREVLLRAVLQEDVWHGVFAAAAAGLEARTTELVRLCVLEERAAGTSWEKIGEPFGISADAARKRWGHWRLLDSDELPGL